MIIHIDRLTMKKLCNSYRKRQHLQSKDLYACIITLQRECLTETPKEYANVYMLL